MNGYRKLAVVGIVALASVVLAGSPVSAQDDTMTCNGKKVTIKGDNGHNRIFGTSGPDVIHAMGGRDRIWGGGGGDTICGGDGADVIFGQRGRDFLDGGNGRDRIVGGVGPDTIIGGRGNDLLNGGFGNDLIKAGPGFDFAFGFVGTDNCDVDWRDGVLGCETGDVLGVNGTTNGTTAISVPQSFVLDSYQLLPTALQANPRTINVYGVQVAISQPNVSPARIVVRDSEGFIVLDRPLAITGFLERIAILADDVASVEVTGLGAGGAYDVAFLDDSLIPKFNDNALSGTGSLLFRLRNPIEAGDTATLQVTPIGGSTVHALVAGMAPGQPPSFQGEQNNITTPTAVPIQVTEGSALYSVQAAGANWTMSINRG